MGSPIGEAGSQGFGGEGENQLGNMNPAWNDVLKEVPSEYHSKLVPHFQGWDSNFQKVQSSTAPYKEFIENQVDPEHIRIALGFARALDENPQAIYEALHAEFGNQGQGQGQQQQQGVPSHMIPEGQGEDGQGFDGSEDGPYAGLPPEFAQQYQQMQEQVNTMRDILMHQHQQTTQADEDAELDSMYKGMAEQDPTFAALNKDGAAEPYINSLMIAGYNEKQALDLFNQFVDSVQQYGNRPKPPVIMGAGGFMPERTVRPRDMTEKQANESIVHMLKTAFNQQ